MKPSTYAGASSPTPYTGNRPVRLGLDYLPAPHVHARCLPRFAANICLYSALCPVLGQLSPPRLYTARIRAKRNSGCSESSRCPLSYPQGFVSAGPKQVPQGLQVAGLVAGSCSLVGGFVVFSEQLGASALRIVPGQPLQGPTGLLGCPLRIPGLYPRPRGRHAPLQARAYLGWTGASHHSHSQSGA